MPRSPVTYLMLLGSLLAPLDRAAESGSGIRLREVAKEWGLDFRHHHGGSGRRYFVETTTGGVVLFDFDRDGDADVFFVDGGRLPGYEGEQPRSRLFRNEGLGRFIDFTNRSGILVLSHAHGAVAGDYDGDGDPDLYVTTFGANQLFRNNGDGSFSDVSEEAGVGDTLWSTGATFADVDLDGDLDLYVVNYVDFGFDDNRICSEKGIQAYCHPSVYSGLPDHFYRNLGMGQFEAATEDAGFGTAHGSGLGVTVGDLDNDGWPDVYVANDATPNSLFRNRGSGKFEDISLLSGTSYSDRGRPEGGMGVDLGDLDADGYLDILVTNFELEANAVYINTGAGFFVDGRFTANLAESSFMNLAFGVALADLDHDADLDLVVANGHILDNAEVFDERSRYAQQNQVFENSGGGRFRELSNHGMEAVRVSRGLAYGDLDGDGDLDLVINNSNDQAEVYENLAGAELGGWLLVDLRGSISNRLGIGARVELEAGGGKQLREVRTASSYLSQNALTLHFGLAGAEEIEKLSVRWPSGRRHVLRDLPVRRRLVMSE